MKSTSKLLISSLCLFTLYTGTIGLAQAATDQWTNITPSGTSGYVFNAISATDEYVFIGTDNGVYKSVNGGSTWGQMNTGLGSTVDITSIAIGSVYNSSSGAYEVTSSSLVFIGTSDGGVFKSTLGGTSWTAVNTGLSDSSILDLKIDQSQATQGSFTDIYAATPSGIFRSSDLGANWHLENSGVSGTPRELTTDFVNGKIYLVTSANKIYSSNLFSVSSASLSWSQIFDANGTTTNSISILNPLGAIGWLATSRGVYKSDDTGTVWASTTTGLPASGVNNVASDYYDSNIAYASVPAYGVYRTTNEAIADADPLTAEWLPINIGLTDLDITDVETDPADSRTVYALSQDALFKLAYSATSIEDIDLTPPGTVSDMLASYYDTDTVELSWTAPGGDENYGTATSYEIRYSTSPINSSNFSSATPVVPQPTPSGRGYDELYFVHGLDLSNTYYFALKSADGPYGGPVVNVSSLSNVASFTLAPRTIGGTVSGMSGTLVLRNNGGDDLTVSANGAFTFSTQIYTGYSYAVTVYSNPAGYSCSVTNGSGTVTGPDITNVTVTCIEVDVTTPTVTAFSIPSSSDSPIVSVTTFTATDNIGVTGYLLSESATAPSISDSGWSASAQTSYTFASAGAKTLYAWAKDAAGNISTSLSDSVTITGHTVGGTTSGLTGTVVLLNNGGDSLSVSGNTSFTFDTPLYASQSYNVTVSSSPAGYGCIVTNGSGTIASSDITNIAVTCTTDTTPPTVTSFTASDSSTATITISSFTATDDTSVSGYLITESPIAPSVSDAGWSITAQTTYTTSNQGTLTLYAWAKDSSGQISSAATQTVTVTLSDTSAPTAPTGLAATAVSSSRINLSWNAATDNVAVTSYRIYRNSTLVATVNELSYGDTGLTASNSYTYYVIAYDAAGNPSSQSSSASATTQAASTSGGGSRGGGGGGGGSTSKSTFPLTIIKTGNGSGTIVSSEPGINCGSSCSHSFDSSTIILAAVPASNSHLSSWSGCTSFTKTACSIDLSINRSVTVSFALGTSTDQPLNIPLSQLSPGTTPLPAIPAALARLSLGSKGPGVIELQKFLNAHGAVIALSGPGSPGKETDYYGNLTVAAVKKYILMLTSPTVSATAPATYPYQTSAFKIGEKSTQVRTLQTFLSGRGYMKATSITGYYGPITDQAFKKYKQEAALAATQKPLCPVGFICTSLTNSISTSTGSSAPSVSVFTKKLMVGMSDPQVKALQQALNSLGFTVALAGVGSPGHESEYFGSLTKAAVIRFQNAHADQILKPVGLTRGTGTFEGITITVLNDLMRRQ